MNRTELINLYNELKSNINLLPDFANISLSLDNKTLNMEFKPSVAANKDDVFNLVMGNIKPADSPEYFDCWIDALCPELDYNDLDGDDGSYTDFYYDIKKQISHSMRKAITYSSGFALVLCALKVEGLIDIANMPLCGRDEDPYLFLDRLIADSKISYKGTIRKYLANLSADEMLVPDPDETPGDKLNRAFVLLSLVELEDIQNKSSKYTRESHILGGFNLNQTFGGYTPTYGAIMACMLTSMPNVPLIFRNAAINGDIPCNDGFNKLLNPDFDHICEVSHIYEDEVSKKMSKKMAVPKSFYLQLLEQCIRTGVETEGWLFCSSNNEGYDDPEIDVWVDEIRPESIERVKKYHCNYILDISRRYGDSSIANSSDFFDFRKYLIDNKLLNIVSYRFQDCDGFGISHYCYQIDFGSTHDEVKFVRLNTEGSFVHNIPVADDSTNVKKGCIFIQNEVIKEYGYDLNIDKYLPGRVIDECENPVRLSDIMRPASMANVCIPDGFRCVKIEHLDTNPLAGFKMNNREAAQLSTKDKWELIDCGQAMYIKQSWPLHPTWISSNDCGEDNVDKKYILDYNLRKETYSLELDLEKADPWYVAYMLNSDLMGYQYAVLTDGKNDRLPVDSILRMFIDLPSIEEQREYILDVLEKESERISAQLGKQKVIFDLNHTIGRPSSALQTTLGVLMDRYKNEGEIYSSLKKIQENYDFICRVIEYYGLDIAEQGKVQHSVQIMPLIRTAAESWGILSPCFRIELKHSIPEDMCVRLNETLFMILMDNAFRNAQKHGFDNRVRPENKLLLSVDSAIYNGESYVCLSIANNGKPLSPDMSINDYISPGRFGKETGHSGQGGHDIYRIVKQFNGFLSLRATEEYPFILDILIPIESTNINTTNKYDYGRSVL